LDIAFFPKASNLEVLAEGVANGGQQDFVMAYSCYLMQGYYFSPPAGTKH